MNHILLLGAGFSRNWGGWLANEAFDYLLGAPGIANNESHRRLLWKYHNNGGFEAALAEVQANYKRDPIGSEATLKDFQYAISEMFLAMNSRFRFLPEKESPADEMLRTFLNRFDAIFTLNQDILMEVTYLGRANIPGPRQWKDVQLPGIEQTERGDPGVV